MQLPLDIERYETVTAKLADQVLRELAQVRNRDDYRLDAWLLAAFELGVERLYGYASFAEYVGRLFDIGPRGVEDRVRTARQLENLPAIREAHRSGEMKYTTARELTRVATAETERDWMRQAEGKSSREIRRMVAGRKRGETPSTPAPPEAQVENVVFREVAPHARARLEEARAQLMKLEGGRIDDGELLARMAEALLATGDSGASSDSGAAPYRKVIHQCTDCGRAEWEAAGSVIDASPVDAAVASCDAQVVDLSASTPKRATQTIPPAVRRAVVHRQKSRCAVPGCENRIWGDCHHLRPRAEGGTHDADNLVYLCPAHHRAAHEGRLLIRGSWSGGLGFEHADGAAYGAPHPRADQGTFSAPHPRADHAARGASHPRADQPGHGAPHPRADHAAYGAPHPRADHAAYGAPHPRTDHAAYDAPHPRADHAAHGASHPHADHAAHSASHPRADHEAPGAPHPRADHAGAPHPRAEQEAHGAPHPRAEQATFSAPHPRAEQATFSAPHLRAEQATFSAPHPRAEHAAHGAPHPRAEQATFSAPHPRADHAELLTSVGDALTGMGFRRREAQGLVEAARPHVQESDGFEQVLRYALRAVPAPASGVRESLAPYVRADRAHADTGRAGRAHADRAHADRAHADRAHADRAHARAA